MRGLYAALKSLVLPYGAGTGLARIVLGSSLPADLKAYYAGLGLTTISGIVSYIGGGSTYEYRVLLSGSAVAEGIGGRGGSTPLPTLADSDAQYSPGTDTSTLTSKPFGVSNGDVMIVKLSTFDTANGMAAPTGGGQTWQPVNVVAPGGFNGWCAVYACTVSGSPGTVTVSAAPATATGTRHSMAVERWTNAKLAAIPATNATVSGSGTPSANITTTADNSALSWVSVDDASKDPTGRAYRLGATEDLFFDGHLATNSVQYGAYVANVGVAGTYAMGMTAPAGQGWVLAGVEIQAATAPTQPVVEAFRINDKGAAGSGFALAAASNFDIGGAWTVDGVTAGRGFVFGGNVTLTADSAAIGTVETVVLTLPALTFKAGRAYSLRLHTTVRSNTAAATCSVNIRDTNAAGTLRGGTWRVNTTAAGAAGEVQLHLDQVVGNNTGADITGRVLALTLTSNSAVNTVLLHAASPTLQTWWEVWDIGTVADHPQAVPL